MAGLKFFPQIFMRQHYHLPRPVSRKKDMGHGKLIRGEDFKPPLLRGGLEGFAAKEYELQGTSW